MRVPRFFHDRPLVEERGVIAMNEEEGRHLFRVMRLGPGDAVRLFDGSSFEAEAVVVSAAKSEVTVELSRVTEVSREPAIFITACLALPRGGAADDVIQKAIESGASHVVPLVAKRSVHRADKKDAREKRRQRFRKLAIATMKQCGRNRMPTLGDVLKLEDLEPDGDGLVGHPGDRAHSIRDEEERRGGFAHRATLVIGPEGGFDDDELEHLERRGFRSVLLTPQVMRIETATVALVTALASIPEHRLRAD